MTDQQKELQEKIKKIVNILSGKSCDGIAIVNSDCHYLSPRAEIGCWECQAQQIVDIDKAHKNPVSRSVQRRIAAQKGEPAPDFSQPEIESTIFPPKSTRTIKGKVVSRTVGEFKCLPGDSQPDKCPHVESLCAECGEKCNEHTVLQESQLDESLLLTDEKIENTVITVFKSFYPNQHITQGSECDKEANKAVAKAQLLKCQPIIDKLSRLKDNWQRLAIHREHEIQQLKQSERAIKDKLVKYIAEEKEFVAMEIRNERKKIGEWGRELCKHTTHTGKPFIEKNAVKRRCYICWNEKFGKNLKTGKPPTTKE
jgi:hypothetical protein